MRSIQGIEPKPRFLLRLATEFPAQQGDPDGQVGLGHKALAFQSVMERRSLKRLLPSTTETCVKSGPFAPRALPRFLATMSRSDSRPWPPRGYGFPRGVARHPRTSPGLPGPSTALSTRALPTHPGQPDACVRSLLPHQLQASSPSEDWPLPLVSRGRIGFASAGLTSSLSQLVSHSPGCHRPAGPTRFTPLVTLRRRAGATW